MLVAQDIFGSLDRISSLGIHSATGYPRSSFLITTTPKFCLSAQRFSSHNSTLCGIHTLSTRFYISYTLTHWNTCSSSQSNATGGRNHDLVNVHFKPRFRPSSCSPHCLTVSNTLPQSSTISSSPQNDPPAKKCETPLFFRQCKRLPSPSFAIGVLLSLWTTSISFLVLL